MTTNTNNSALVMSGGGAYGAFQVGCVQSIRANLPTRDYDFYAGISVGAINAALLAQYDSFEAGMPPLLDLWTGIKSHRDVWRWTIWWYFRGLWCTGIYDTSPLRKTIDDNLDVERLNNSGKGLLFGATNILTGGYEEVMKPANEPLPPTAKPMLVEWLMASSAFPGAFPAVAIGDGLYLDGGLKNAAPTTFAVHEGFDTIDVLLTGPKDNITSTTADKVTSVLSLLPRVLETLFLTVWVEDLYTAYLLNQQRSQPATIQVYAPTEPLPFDPLGFAPEEIASMMQMGQATTPIPLEQFLFPDGDTWDDPSARPGDITP